jgi:hypothetical protein
MIHVEVNMSCISPTNKSELRSCPQVDKPCETPPAFAKGQKQAFCDQCKTTVHNLSALSAREQTSLLDSGKELCVRYVRIIPAVVLISGSASAQSLSAQNDTQPNDAQQEELGEVIVGGYTVKAPMFMQTEGSDASELDESTMEHPDEK